MILQLQTFKDKNPNGLIENGNNTKIIIDSLNEKEIALDKGDKGITKFSKYLKAKNYKDASATIALLRNLQDLRDGAAYRKGDKYKRGSEYFKVDEKGFIKALDEILTKATEMLGELEKNFL